MTCFPDESSNEFFIQPILTNYDIFILSRALKQKVASYMIELLDIMEMLNEVTV